MTTSIPQHYGAADIVERVLAAIPWARDSGAPLTAQQIYPYDQFHGRELRATQEHAAKLNPPKQSHLLDIGSGIGGPARYFASTFGCHITGIDLTPDFVIAATEISALCNLDSLLTFVEADAATAPFAANMFDHAYSFYVGMNLADKPKVLRECLRVLKPGGRVLWTEVTNASGDPHYPLPWSRNPEGSHVQTRETLVAFFETAGFEILSVDDETSAHLELVRQMKLSGKVPTAGQQQANEVMLGADFAERRKNYIQSLAEGRIASTLIDARKPY
jgi:ubiquinone/menaquinone biosynthesis C-methylase UbiE